MYDEADGPQENRSERNTTPFQEASVYCQVEGKPGRLYLRMNSSLFPSFLGTTFNLMMLPESSRADADALAELINKHCHTLVAAFADHPGISEEEKRHLIEWYDDAEMFGPEMDELRARCAPTAMHREIPR